MNSNRRRGGRWYVSLPASPAALVEVKSMGTVKEHVERGRKLLDKVMPGWENKIDLNRLDLASTCDCVLGQLYGDYGSGVEVLMGADKWWTGTAGEATSRKHGFDAPINRYATLTMAWVRFIVNRLRGYDR